MESAIVLYDRPRAEIVNMSIMAVSEEQVDMNVDLEVDNPGSEALQVVDIDFLFEDVVGNQEAERRMLVKNIRRPCMVPPNTSEIIKIPLQLVYRDVTPSTPADRPGHAGAIIPFTVRANLHCVETLRGVFEITISKLKQFLTIVDRRLGGSGGGMGGQLRSFVPPFGSLEAIHVLEASSTMAKLNVSFRVRNNNPVPVQLLYTNISVEGTERTTGIDQAADPAAGQRVYFSAKVDNNITLRGNSSRKVTIPVSIAVDEVLERYPDVEPGTTVPCIVKTEYWFKENFYGTYKVTAEKEAEFPVPVKPEIRIETITFGLSGSNPVAKLIMQVRNKNNFNLSITKLEYHIEQNGSTVITADHNVDAKHPVVVDAKSDATVELVAQELHPSFGSAIWKVFAEDYSTYKVRSLVEAHSASFGNLFFS